jgi:hypothetical protein
MSLYNPQCTQKEAVVGSQWFAAVYPFLARNAIQAKMTTTTIRMMRAMPIIRVCATGRVPLAFIPVTAAMAVKTTASPTQTIQFMAD